MTPTFSIEDIVRGFVRYQQYRTGDSDETNWIDAPPNKYEGEWNGVPVYSNPLVPDGILYFINEDNFMTQPSTHKESWEYSYRQKYEGANVWSSKAIDSQIADIKDIISTEKERLIQRLEKETFSTALTVDDEPGEDVVRLDDITRIIREDSIVTTK